MDSKNKEDGTTRALHYTEGGLGLKITEIANSHDWKDVPPDMMENKNE